MIAANVNPMEVPLTPEQSRLIPNHFYQQWNGHGKTTPRDQVATGKEIFDAIKIEYEREYEINKRQQRWHLFSRPEDKQEKALFRLIESYLLDPSRKTIPLREDGEDFFNLVSMILSGLFSNYIEEQDDSTSPTPMHYALIALLDNKKLATGLGALKKAELFTAENWHLMYWENIARDQNGEPDDIVWKHDLYQSCKRLLALKEAMKDEKMSLELKRAALNMDISSGNYNPLILLKRSGILTPENMMFLQKGFKNLYQGALIFSLLQKAKILTPENCEALCSIEYFQQSEDLKEFELLKKISISQNTQDFWDNIIQCGRQKNPKNALYAYMMGLAVNHLNDPNNITATAAIVNNVNNTTSSLPICSAIPVENVKVRSQSSHETFVCGRITRNGHLGNVIVRQKHINSDKQQNKFITTYYGIGICQQYPPSRVEIKGWFNPMTCNIHPATVSQETDLSYAALYPKVPVEHLVVSLDNLSTFLDTTVFMGQDISWVNHPKYGIKSLEIFSIFLTLQKAELLNPESIKSIRNRVELWHALSNEQQRFASDNQGERITHLAEILRSLYAGFILTKARFESLLLPENDLMLRSQSVQLLLRNQGFYKSISETENVWDNLVRYSQQENFETKISNISELINLQRPRFASFTFLLTPENDALMGCSKLADLIGRLSREKRQSTWNTLQGYGQQENCARKIANLAGILNIQGAKEHHDFFLAPANDILLGRIGLSDALSNKWLDKAINNIPIQSLTQTVWGELLTCCSQENPKAALETYTVQLLAELDRQRNVTRRAAGLRVEEGGNRQGVHVQSVHATVANSLLALHERYHASAENEHEKIQEKLAEVKKFVAILEFIFKYVDDERRHYSKIAIKALDKNAVSLDQLVKEILRLERLSLNPAGNENLAQDTIQTLKVRLSERLDLLANECISAIFPENPEKPQTPEEIQVIDQFKQITLELLNALSEGKFDFRTSGSDSRELGVAAQLDSAAQCLKRLMKLGNVEQETRFHMKKVIALVWQGVLDKSAHYPGGLNVLGCFIHELFNMQDRDGIKNNSACASGSLNDTLNALNGLHQDVNIILLDEPNVAKIVSDEAKIICESFILTQNDNAFSKKIDMISEQVLVKLLVNSKANAIKAIDTKLQRAKFTPDQMKHIKAGGNYDIGVDRGIEKALMRLKNNQYSDLRGLIKTTYLEKYLLEEKHEVKDDFDRLYRIVEEARTKAISYLRPVKIEPAEKVSVEKADSGSDEEFAGNIRPDVAERLESQAKALSSIVMSNSLATQSVFKNSNINEKLINAFLEKLREKNYVAIVSWLRDSSDADGASNLSKLSEGIFGRQLKNYFYADGRIEDKVFCCDDLAKLADCIAGDGKQKMPDQEIMSACTMKN